MNACRHRHSTKLSEAAGLLGLRSSPGKRQFQHSDVCDSLSYCQSFHSQFESVVLLILLINIATVVNVVTVAAVVVVVLVCRELIIRV